MWRRNAEIHPSQPSVVHLRGKMRLCSLEAHDRPLRSTDLWQAPPPSPPSGRTDPPPARGQGWPLGALPVDAGRGAAGASAQPGRHAGRRSGHDRCRPASVGATRPPLAPGDRPRACTTGPGVRRPRPPPPEGHGITARCSDRTPSSPLRRTQEGGERPSTLESRRRGVPMLRSAPR